MKYLALCIMCKDEHLYLKENIDYHTLLGVDHFLIYDNGSNPPLAPTFKNYPNVTVENWSDKERGSHGRCFKFCLEKYRGSFQWIGFIDTDEFIVLKKGSTNLKEFLKGYGRFGGLGIQWKCFGASGHKKQPPNVIQSYLHAAGTKDDDHIKTIVQTKYTVNSRGPHCFSYVNGKCCVNEHKKIIPSNWNRPPSWDKIQLNHYVTRSRHDFEEKRKRGGGNDRTSKKLTEGFWNRFQGGKKDISIIHLLDRIKRNSK